jgi:hypothetical protein
MRSKFRFMEITCALNICANNFSGNQADSWRSIMKTLVAFAATLVLAAPVLANSQPQDGKGLYPQWLINHEG